MPEIDKPQDADILLSIVDRLSGFVFRCRNDADYAMIYMQGDVLGLTGYTQLDFLGLGQQSYAQIIHPQDAESVAKHVDDALGRRGNWNVDYRVIRADGAERWVHETGGGVFVGDRLLYLEGLVIDTDAQKRSDIANSVLLGTIADNAGLLVGSSLPIIDILKTLRILAINARIEAGRAGDAGAGFSVVAREVGRLADASSDMAEQMGKVARQLQAMLKKP